MHTVVHYCGTLYSDAEGKTIIDEPATIGVLGHKYDKYTAVDITTHKQVCANNASHVVTSTHSFDTNNKCTECGLQKYIVTIKAVETETKEAVIAGEKFTEPTAPSVPNGYTFDGWYNGETKYNFNEAVTTDLTLIAKFKVIPVYIPDYSGSPSTPSASDKTESSTTTTVTPSGNTVKVETETKADGTKVETTTTTTASGETTKVEVTTETNKEGTTVETTVTTDSKGETSTSVTATLDNGSAVTNNDDAVEVEVSKVEEKVVEQVEEAVAADETVTVVGTADNAVSVSATDVFTGATQASFTQPMSVSVPVDTTVLNNVTDTSKLTMAKVVTNEDGTTGRQL